MFRALSAVLFAGFTLIGLVLFGSASAKDGINFGNAGASNGLERVEEGPNYVPLQGADLQQALGNPDHSVLPSNGGSLVINGPKFDPTWVLTGLVAGFAAGYGVRSLVSSRRHRRALRSRFGSLTSDRHFKRKIRTMSIIARADVGDLQSGQRPPTAA